MSFAFTVPEWLFWLLACWSAVCGAGVLYFGYCMWRMFWKGDVR